VDVKVSAVVSRKPGDHLRHIAAHGGVGDKPSFSHRTDREQAHKMRMLAGLARSEARAGQAK
jgi:hypothetical protein